MPQYLNRTWKAHLRVTLAPQTSPSVVNYANVGRTAIISPQSFLQASGIVAFGSLPMAFSNFSGSCHRFPDFIPDFHSFVSILALV